MKKSNQMNLPQQSYDKMIQTFKKRQEQTSLQQALVYLKLREHQCNNNKALIFAKKREKCIDGTINKDGPPGFRKLQVLKPESKLTNGWLRGEKLKYAGTIGYADYLSNHESVQKRQITKYNQKDRQIQQQSRKTRSKSVVSIDMMRPRQSIEKIGAIKEEASKQRQNRIMFIEFDGMKLDQTTKNFFKDTENIDDEGLIVKLGAFQQVMTDKNLNIKIDQRNMKGKQLSNNEKLCSNKRRDILLFQQKIKLLNDDSFAQHDEKNKNSLYKQINKHKLVLQKDVQTASNALILMNTQKLKRQMSENIKKYKQTLTSYSNFYKSLEKAVKIQFLNKRKTSLFQINSKKRQSLQIQKDN